MPPGSTGSRVNEPAHVGTAGLDPVSKTSPLRLFLLLSSWLAAPRDRCLGLRPEEPLPAAARQFMALLVCVSPGGSAHQLPRVVNGRFPNETTEQPQARAWGRQLCPGCPLPAARPRLP